MNNKRVLVISNNCFSLSNSNGRTLGSFFQSWPRECLAQFCIIPRDPDWSLCNNYYCIDDNTMLYSFLKCKKAIGYKLSKNGFILMNDAVKKKESNKTVVKILLRQLVWAFKRWKSDSFMHWVNKFDPEMVLLQFGDTTFMLQIAQTIARERNIPLVVFNTEGYYFFKKNCFNHSWSDFVTYPFYSWYYRNTVRRFMRDVKYAIYCNSMLDEDYSREFGIQSTVLYTGSTMTFTPQDVTPENVKFRYLGNLSLERDSGLVEIGEVLNSINPNYHIDVYGVAPKGVEEKFKNAVGVEFHGSISYAEVQKVINQSDLLFHVETQYGLGSRLLKYGFSTKIADSIASGKCFVLYAPRDMAGSKYILETGAGWFADNKNELKNQIMTILYEKSVKDKVIECARIISEQNHDIETNAHKLQQILNSI